MPSILPDYQYDIFISYRQKDNKSGWVTEFIKHLRNEIDATFKEDISIYFDSNPHDGLQETHDVDGSLRDKVKSIVFVPIVSQTYCDPNSFAWQKEFLAFLEFVKSDEIGLDVTLPGGNVAKRILPIRIHEIDDEDQNLFEEKVGGVMRPVDFIFKSSGVNRPLLPDEEDSSANLVGLNYRDQVNKVANAIKDLLNSIKNHKDIERTETIEKEESKSPSVATSNQMAKAFGFILAYLAGSWGFLEILSLMLERFQVSPYWTEIFLYTLVLFTPGFLSIILIPRETNKKNLQLLRRFMPPVNVAFIAVVLIITFWGRDLGAMTREITYEEEDGTTITQKVLKDSYIIKITMGDIQTSEEFPEEEKWTADAIMDGIFLSAGQYDNVHLSSSDLEEFSLKSQVDELIYDNSDYFITSNLKKSGDSLSIHFEIVSGDGNVYDSRNITEVDLFQVINNSHEYLSSLLKFKASKVILPFNEFVTGNIEAYKAYVNGDITGAIEKDSTFALAWLEKINGATQLNSNPQVFGKIADQGIKYVDKLPDAYQTLFKFLYWYAKGDHVKSERVINKYITLHPNDKRALNWKAIFCFRTGRMPEAIDLYKELLEGAFDESRFHHAFQLSLITNDIEDAELLLSNYGDRLPSYSRMIGTGLINIHKQDYDSAISLFEEAKLENPNLNVTDSLVAVSNYLREYQDQLEDLVNKASGTYFNDAGSRQILFKYNGACFYYLINSGPGTDAYAITASYPIRENQLFNFDILSRNPNSSGNTFILGEDSEGVVYKAAATGRFFPLIKQTARMELAIQHFENKEYKIADSLFKAEYEIHPDFYFLENYRKIIAYRQSPSKKDLISKLVEKKFIRYENTEFAFNVIPADDHILFEFNFSQDRIYPTEDNWLINIDSRRNHYKVRETPNGIVIDRYVYNVNKNELEKANSYREYRPEVL